MLPRIDHTNQNTLLCAIADVLGNTNLPVPTETTIRVANGHAHITVRLATDRLDQVRDWAHWIGGVPRHDVDPAGPTEVYATPMMLRPDGSTFRAYCRLTTPEDQR